MGFGSVMLGVEVESDWTVRANCIDVENVEGENPFFVEGYGSQYPRARDYCSGCPVVVDCLVHSVFEDAIYSEDGMWGCMSPNERKELMNYLSEGKGFKAAAERIWTRQRRRRNGSKVPNRTVWDNWNA